MKFGAFLEGDTINYNRCWQIRNLDRKTQIAVCTNLILPIIADRFERHTYTVAKNTGIYSGIFPFKRLMKVDAVRGAKE